MNISKLITLISSIPPDQSENYREIILTELKKIGIKSKGRHKWYSIINKIIQITDNQKTRESYLRSYFRIYQEGIDLDGRRGSIVIEITKKCNKNCLHCYSKFAGQKNEMADHVLDSIIRFARKHYKHIFLTGGEPTLDPRVFSLARNNPDMMFFMFTNGSTITDEYAQRLSSVGNLIPILSIDGSSEATHERLREKGSYKEIENAIEHFNKNKVPWGYISMVTEINAEEVLSPEFIEDKIKKGAFIVRYLEYLPVGPTPQNDLILSGETYYLLEKRKKEIINSKIIYMQETTQKKCNGLLYFDVNGNIKNCFCFHYSKYNVEGGNIQKSVEKTVKDWLSYHWKGECPLYSDPIEFKNHLKRLGWKKISLCDEPYLTNPQIAHFMISNYKRFLKIKAQQGL